MNAWVTAVPVSYTHLDVYKRQPEAPEQGQVSELWRVAERPERAAFLSGQAAPCLLYTSMARGLERRDTSSERNRINGIFKGRGRRRIPGAIAQDRLNGKGLPPHLSLIHIYGKPITSKPVYGYLMDEDENFIIDEEAAPDVYKRQVHNRAALGRCLHFCHRQTPFF